MMMMKLHVQALALTAALWSIGVSLALEKKDVTSSYFGGMDHAPYLDWIEASSHNYRKSVYIPARQANNNFAGVALHWRLDETDIHIAVAARATGWVGFGISESGGMTGSDMVLFTAADPTNELVDAHVTSVRAHPTTDTSCQDWTLKNSTTVVVDDDEDNGNGFIIFEAQRRLDTMDPQDRPIPHNDGSVETVASRVIAAWGNEETVTFHGQNVALGSVRFHETEPLDFAAVMERDATGYFELHTNYTVMPQHTEYVNFCYSEESLIAQGVPMEDQEINIIGFEPFGDGIDQLGGTKLSNTFVHHLGIIGSAEPNNEFEEGPGCTAQIMELAYPWSPGDGALALPSNVGMALGQKLNGHRSFRINIHYDNLRLLEGQLDNTAVRVYYSTKIREYQAGLFGVGDPFLQLRGNVNNGIVVADRNTEDAIAKNGIHNDAGYTVRHDFECPASCTGTWLPEKGVTVFREFMHMHESGRRQINRQVRNGTIVREGRVDYFEANQQAMHAVQQEPFEMLPGDSFKTSCFYKPQEDTVFGKSSLEEMCIGYLMYYPRIAGYGPIGFNCGINMPIPGCAGPHVNDTALTSSQEELPGFANAVADTCAPNTALGNNNNNEHETVVGNDTTGSAGLRDAAFTTSAVVMIATVFYIFRN